MEYVPILILLYVFGVMISTVTLCEQSGNWATGMPLSETIARIMTWPIWIAIFVCKGFFKAIIREITKF